MRDLLFLVNLELVADPHGLEGPIGKEIVYTATNTEGLLPHFLAFHAI